MIDFVFFFSLFFSFLLFSSLFFSFLLFSFSFLLFSSLFFSFLLFSSLFFYKCDAYSSRAGLYLTLRNRVVTKTTGEAKERVAAQFVEESPLVQTFGAPGHLSTNLWKVQKILVG